MTFGLSDFFFHSYGLSSEYSVWLGKNLWDLRVFVACYSPFYTMAILRLNSGYPYFDHLE